MPLGTRTRTQSYRGRKDSALALYYLWYTGEVMTHHRKNFERVAYYKTSIASAVFKRCDTIQWEQLMSWAKARHPNKGSQWMVKKYWHQVEERKWVFVTPKGVEMRMHSKTSIQRYNKVKGTASPYDGKLLYWSQCLKKHPMMHETKAQLLP